jgi:hypothetical protein
VGYLASVQMELVIFTLPADLQGVLQAHGVKKRRSTRTRHPLSDAMRPGTTTKYRVQCPFLLKIIFLHQTILTEIVPKPSI